MLIFSPCIMCVQYIGGCLVHWGETMSTSGGHHEYIGGYHEYIRGVQCRDIMMHVGDIMSTLGDV